MGRARRRRLTLSPGNSPRGRGVPLRNQSETKLKQFVASHPNATKLHLWREKERKSFTHRPEIARKHRDGL